MKQQPFAISGIDDYGKTRVMIYQGGQEGTVPATALRDGLMPLDADLTALAALTGTGYPARTADNTWALRTLTAPAAGITISNPAGVAGNSTFALANDLAAIEGLSTTGIARRTATDTWATLTYSAAASFTPTVIGLSSAGVGTYTTQVGSFVQIADAVLFRFDLAWSAHTGTGNIAINTSGLPSPGGSLTSIPVLLNLFNYTGAGAGVRQQAQWASNTQIQVLADGAAVAIDTNAVARGLGFYFV